LAPFKSIVSKPSALVTAQTVYLFLDHAPDVLRRADFHFG
jgi:hypothetical protein